jgi:phosphotransferase system enzyme I (PtsI)
MAGRPIIVRTLDIGGDKQLPYLGIEPEQNPFLGWRAIRYCLDNPALFKTQLRAILRASADHDLRIMFPMIATVTELRRAKALLDEARAELREQGVDYDDDLAVGIMIEVPASALGAGILAGEVDFFSIGTNDLIQYAMACDRGNERIAYLYQPLHPVVVRLVSEIVSAGHAAGIWVGMCGEMAGDLEAIPLLVGLGVDELSMNPTGIPEAKHLIRQMRAADAQELVRNALKCGTAQEVRNQVQAFVKGLHSPACPGI